MKLVKRRIFTSILACFMVCIMFSIPVFAASSYFSKGARLSTDKKTSITSGSIAGEDIQITQVKIYINRSSGTTKEDFVVCLESPSGTVVKFKPSNGSATYYISSFNGENPKGTWYAWLEVGENAQIQNVTVSATVTVTYSY